MWLGEPLAATSGSLVQLETNIDDMNPQLYPAVSERLLAAGAKDVWFTPVHMKKGRPGVMLSVLGTSGTESNLSNVILRETTTLGVRVHAVQHRHEARREVQEVQTPFGNVRAKIKWIGDEPVQATPEYEDCRALAERTQTSVKSVHDAALAAAQALLTTLRSTARTENQGIR
jgi:uncharacterized protein (DUF111 family)